MALLSMVWEGGSAHDGLLALLSMGLPTAAGAMLLECEGDDAALAELGITSRLAVGKLRSSLRALAARR